MKYLLCLILLVSTSAISRSQDSLFISSEPNGLQLVTNNQVELGMVFKSIVRGKITHIKFYKPVASDAAVYTVNLWTYTGTLLTSQTYSANGKSGWQRVALNNPVAVEDNTNYVVSYHCKSGKYVYKASIFQSDRKRGDLIAPATNAVNGNGRYAYSTTPKFPNQTFASSTYFVDVVFQRDNNLPAIPLVVNAGENVTLSFPTDSIQLRGLVTGDDVTWKWTMVGDDTWSSTELNPKVKNLKLWLYAFVLTGKDRWGNEKSSIIEVKVQRPTIVLFNDGTWKMWGTEGVIIEPESFMGKTFE